MKFFATGVVVLVSLVSRALALTVNTPASVVQCQPILLTWTGGAAPYFLSIIPGGQPSAAAIKSFATQNGTSLTWVTDISAGTSITVSLKDSTGTQAFTDALTVQPSSDSSCVNSSASASGIAAATTGGSDAGTALGAASSSAAPLGTAAGATSAAAAASGTVVSSSSRAAAVASSASGSRTAAAAASASASAARNAGSRSTVGTYGLAGVMGLIGVALF